MRKLSPHFFGGFIMLNGAPGICQCVRAFCGCAGKCAEVAAVALFSNSKYGYTMPARSHEVPPPLTHCPSCALTSQFHDSNVNTAVLSVLFPTTHKQLAQARFLLG